MHERTTKYTTAVAEFVQRQRHATNADILTELQKTHPNLSATTVHRITSRMVERGDLALAPPSCDNCTRFDSTTDQHDHFSCKNCDCLRDVALSADVRHTIESSLSGCSFNGPIVIQGTCQNCIKKENPA